MHTFRLAGVCVVALAANHALAADAIPAPSLTASTDAIDRELPAELRAALDAANRREADSDLASAYAQLREVRARGDCPVDLANQLDRRRNALAQRLADDLEQQAAAQLSDQRPVFAEKFHLQALAFRAAVADELERFYALPEVIQALGGAAAVLDHRRRLGNIPSADGLRWQAHAWARDAAATPPRWADLDAQLARLDNLIVIAGAADDDVVAWTRNAVRHGAALNESTVNPGQSQASRAHLLALAHQVLGAEDASAGELARTTAAAEHREQLVRLGARESTWNIRLDAWHATLKGGFDANATPTSTLGGFTTRADSASVNASAPGARVELAWLCSPAPAGADYGASYGLALVTNSARATADLVLADPDTGGASLDGQRFASNLGVFSVGLDLSAGAHWRLGGDDSPWSVEARGFAGLHALRLSYGTRRGAVDGSGGDQTEHLSGSLIECGAEIEAAWRFAVHWAVVGDLGFDYALLSTGGSSSQGTFTNSTGTVTTSGSYSERFKRLTLSGPYLGVGVRASF